jgi:hypothetical protein
LQGVDCLLNDGGVNSLKADNSDRLGISLGRLLQGVNQLLDVVVEFLRTGQRAVKAARQARRFLAPSALGTEGVIHFHRRGDRSHRRRPDNAQL